MLSVKQIIEKRKEIELGLRKKGWTGSLESLLALDQRRRDLIKAIEPLRAFQKEESRKIPGLKEEEQKDRKKALSRISHQIKELHRELDQVEESLRHELLALPNPSLPDVPEGESEKDNQVIKEWGKPPSFSFTPRHHLEIGEELGIIDVKRAAKVSGSRFGYLLGEAFWLQWALLMYCSSLLRDEGFIPVLPPVLAREQVIFDMGYLPEADLDMFKIEKDGLRLAATSEHTLGPYYAGEILEEQELPKKFMGYSSCFRREAGSYGRDVKGIMRVHQFDKLEMFVFCRPQDSQKMHDYLLSLEERIVQGLGICYRVVNVCGGELGFPAAKKYDLECWIPSEGRFRETHSCSNCLDFQARRLNLRYRSLHSKKPEFLHTLNATAIAFGRMIVAILENYQQEDGSVKIPEVLVPWLDGKRFILRG